eukprot:717625-Rhodomonas_salina.1
MERVIPTEQESQQSLRKTKCSQALRTQRSDNKQLVSCRASHKTSSNELTAWPTNYLTTFYNLLLQVREEEVQILPNSNLNLTMSMSGPC